MKKIAFTEEQCIAAMDEMDRRIKMDIEDGDFKYESEVIEYRKAMMQGIFGTFMCMASNWPDVAGWLSTEFEDRYCKEPHAMKQWNQATYGCHKEFWE